MADNRVVWPGLAGVMHGLHYQETVLQKLVQISLVLVIALFFSLLGLLFFALKENEPIYFGMNQQMQILPMYPLHQPMYTDAAITSFAAQAATTLFNLDFLHWREQLMSQRSYFSKKAYLSYRQSLKDEGHLTILSQYKALMHGVVRGMPLIVASGVLDKRMTWEVEIPFALAYETSTKVLSEQNVLIRMRIQRMATSEYVRGIAIVQLIVESGGSYL